MAFTLRSNKQPNNWLSSPSLSMQRPFFVNRRSFKKKPRANVPEAILNCVTAVIHGLTRAANWKSLAGLIWMLSWSSNAVFLWLPCCGVQDHCSMNWTRESIYCDWDTWTETCMHMNPQTHLLYLLPTFALIFIKQIHNETTLTYSQIQWTKQTTASATLVLQTQRVTGSQYANITLTILKPFG